MKIRLKQPRNMYKQLFQKLTRIIADCRQGWGRGHQLCGVYETDEALKPL